MKQILAYCNIPCNTNTKQIFCACQLAKSQKLSFSSSTSRVSHPLALVHSDLWGPAPILSTTSARYFLLFVDDFSRFTWIYVLHSKDQVSSTFLKFKALVETQFNLSIKNLQSNNGGEFKALAPHLAKHGIHHQFSCPYTPEQNGRAERKIRHIVETGLALLNTASLSLKFWTYAFQTAVHLINCMPTPTLQHMSPFQILFHKLPDYRFFKTFGCLCYPYLRPYSSNKLLHRLAPCIFLGYNLSHKGYLCLHHSTNRIYITRLAIFDESNFLFHSSTSLPSSSTSFQPVITQQF